MSIKFLTKKSAGAYVYLPQEWNMGLQRLKCFKYYYLLKREGSRLPKIPIISENDSI